jgi:hypothetical protein
MSHLTPNKARQAEQDLIEQQTAEFLDKGSKVQREEIRETKTVDLTWRNYASGRC